MTGRWKTLFAWGVIAVAGLIYLASLLPVVAAMEEGGVVVSDQLPSSASDTISMTMAGTGEPEWVTASADAQTSLTDGDTGLDTQFSAIPDTYSPEDETDVTQEPTATDEIAADLGETTPSDSDETTAAESGESASAESDETTSTDSGDTTPTEPEETTTESGETALPEPGEIAPTDPGPTGELDPAEEVIEPVEPTLDELLAGFIATRLGLVTAGTTFPIHDVDVTGEFVFQTPSIDGSHFSATKGRQIPTGFSALTSYGDGTMSGFELYRNIKDDNPFGDFYISMSADGPISFNGLSMEVTELYAQQLIGVRIFPLLDFWTTNPGEDLPFGQDENPLAPDIPFYGSDFKVTAIKMTADHIEISNFSLSVAPGTTQLGS